MTEIAVVYYSGYGHTHELAKAVAEGASSADGAQAKLYRIESATEDFTPMLEALSGADAIIFGAPTYMGTAPYQFKAFMDASSKVWYARGWADKLAGGFVNSASQNGDKQTTLIQLATFAAQHGMLWVPLNMLPGNNSTQGSPDDLNRLGGSIGALAQSNADAGPDAAPTTSDKKTAAAYGKRIAEAARRWAKK